MPDHELRNPLTVLNCRPACCTGTGQARPPEMLLLPFPTCRSRSTPSPGWWKSCWNVSKIQAGRLEYLREMVDLDPGAAGDRRHHAANHPSHTILVQGAVQASLLGSRDRLGEVFHQPAQQRHQVFSRCQTSRWISPPPRDGHGPCPDHGPGIPREQRRQDFERFYRRLVPSREPSPVWAWDCTLWEEIIKRHGRNHHGGQRSRKGSSFTEPFPSRGMPTAESKPRASSESVMAAEAVAARIASPSRPDSCLFGCIGPPASVGSGGKAR